MSGNGVILTQNWCPAYFFFFELESLFPIFGSYWVANTFNVVANVVNAGFLGFNAVLCHVTAFDFWGTCKRQGSSRRGLPLSYMASCCQGRHPGAQQFKHPVTSDFLGNIQIVGILMKHFRAHADGLSQIFKVGSETRGNFTILHHPSRFDEVRQPWSFSCNLSSWPSLCDDFLHLRLPVDSSVHPPT